METCKMIITHIYVTQVADPSMLGRQYSALGQTFTVIYHDDDLDHSLMRTINHLWMDVALWCHIQMDG